MITKYILIAIPILVCFFVGLQIYCSVQERKDPDKDINYYKVLKDIVLIIGLVLVTIITLFNI